MGRNRDYGKVVSAARAARKAARAARREARAAGREVKGNPVETWAGFMGTAISQGHDAGSEDPAELAAKIDFSQVKGPDRGAVRKLGSDLKRRAGVVGDLEEQRKPSRAVSDGIPTAGRQGVGVKSA